MDGVKHSHLAKANPRQNIGTFCLFLLHSRLKSSHKGIIWTFSTIIVHLIAM